MANETVFERYEGNPIVTPEAVPGANTIFNSAVVPFGDGYAGVFRCDMDDGAPELHAGRSDDALQWRLDPDPIQFETDDAEVRYLWGYDPRVTEIEGTYYISWCNEYHGPSIAIGATEDFRDRRAVRHAPPAQRCGPHALWRHLLHHQPGPGALGQPPLGDGTARGLAVGEGRRGTCPHRDR
jgi:predicted GH43/DUF377 family glycosyl hydrolase